MNDQPTRDKTTAQDDIDTISLAIQELDDREGHKPNGWAMRAQAALIRLRERLENNHGE